MLIDPTVFVNVLPTLSNVSTSLNVTVMLVGIVRPR